MNADPADFSAPLLRIQDKPPAPLAGWMLWLLLSLTAFVVLWSALGPLDIVAVAEGKLVPSGYLKIVQPAEQGIVREILVREGEPVAAGQVLIRMDSVLAAADVKAMQVEHQNRRLALRRVDAQLTGKKFSVEQSDPRELALQVEAQYAANVRAYRSSLAQEKSLLEKSKHDLEAARQTRAKLEQVLPHYIEQEKAFEKLTKDGFAGRILYTDKRRERIEKEQDLHAQESIIRANMALIEQSEQKLAQIAADYGRQLQAERMQLVSQLDKLTQELAKLAHRHELLELRAPQAGTVKDLATHTVGTVAAPGTILMTLVPQGERLVAEVWVSNEDVGFVRAGQAVKLKLAAFQFTQYGMVEGTVRQVSADATEAAYRTLVDLKAEHLHAGGVRHSLTPGMQVAAEINLGTRTVLEYVLSPVRQAFHEAGRER
jgi:hemolysin D